ncbi:MAG: transporter, partial [Rhodocyclaceae bacterium]
VPYNEKVDESGGQNSRGFADMSLMGQIGFKYDQGFKLIPQNESLDDLEDWHFSVFAGATLPTGDANHRLGDGTIDPSKSLGFGKPSYSLGLTASKMLTDTLTLSFEASALRFREYTYDDGQRVRFGGENRFNTALSYRALTIPDKMFRLDPVLEIQYLGLGRDREDGVGARGTGGQMVYAMPGVRAYWQNASFALGFKKPVWTRLNESSEQQGAEGKEKYRLVFSASLLF